MERVQSTTKVAGVDVSKLRLDVALHGGEEHIQVDNATRGLNELVNWLKQREVGRVGLEATGGYERACRSRLEAEGFEVVMHQPIEVRLFARLKRLRAKNDRADAALIAAATAQVDAVRAAQDPRLHELAERLTAYEQIADQVAQLKTMLEHASLKDVIAMLRDELARRVALKKKLADDIVRRLKQEPDLLERFRLLTSLPGVGPIVAASLVVRMPELGAMRRGQAASLLGVAPFDRDSGQLKGKRFVAGGRARPRRMIYLSALAARRWDPGLKAFTDRLIARGKPGKLAIVALMRKLIEAANLVLSRGTPWERRPAT